jgi:hypothetical protein
VCVGKLVLQPERSVMKTVHISATEACEFYAEKGYTTVPQSDRSIQLMSKDTNRQGYTIEPHSRPFVTIDLKTAIAWEY